MGGGSPSSLDGFFDGKTDRLIKLWMRTGGSIPILGKLHLRNGYLNFLDEFSHSSIHLYPMVNLDFKVKHETSMGISWNIWI